MQLLESIDIGKAIITLYDDNFIVMHFKDNVDFLLEDAILTDKTYEKLCKRKPYKTLVDGRNVFSAITSEARQHFANNEYLSGLKMAEALLVNNLANRLIANFYIKFNRPKNPTKVFTDKEKAISWLKSFD